MRIYEHFPYTGAKQHWVVPEGVTLAEFECWGAAGGMPSGLAFAGKKRQVVGGTAPRNDSFFNNPWHQTQLGVSFANNAGYAAGIKTVTAGDTYYVYVGGNGGPGHSTIKLKENGTTYEVAFRGGAAGWNGGGSGGNGAHVYQNLYDSTSTAVHYKKSTMPASAKSGQLWYDTANHLVKQCNTTYTSGNGTAAKWTTITHTHTDAAGPSGGGGGGATDIRHGGDAISNRILVAGGGGGAGGQFNRTGTAAWSLRQVPVSPAPPFGTDTTASGATGPDSTWATAVNYLVGGWGGGGLGGATAPTSNTAPTTDGGFATAGGSGGPATARHKDGSAPGSVNGSGGKGGTAVAGGARGHGGSNGQSGSKGQGGNGADADGGYDDWCAGGGGGGGGYYGGGGGGQGFKVSGQDGSIHTRGGGGGGGSNYVDPSFSSALLGGGAQPPFAKANSGTGANGLGGFARITYHILPKVSWTSAPAVANAGANFDVSFEYQPAQAGGKGISYYIIGTSATPTDTVPTSQTTFMVTDPTLTAFTHTFTAPANGVQQAYFVQVVDLDGDASPWLRQKVTGLTAPTPTAITSPAAGSAFETTVSVGWTVGSQTPLCAYRLGVTGSKVSQSKGAAGVIVDSHSGWRRGGSRVNLAIDPGFQTASWASTSNVALVSDNAFPGVSGKDGRITWNIADDGSAENHTVYTYDNLVPDTAYRLHLGVASSIANDIRPIEVQVYDANGLLTSQVYDLSATAAGTYVVEDIEFTPHTQGVYFVVRPAGSATTSDALMSLDFEGGVVTPVVAINGGTVTADNVGPTGGNYQGDYSVHVTGFFNGALGDVDMSSYLTGGAGYYFLSAWVYAPSASDRAPTLAVGGTGVTSTHSGAIGIRDQWVHLRVPFHWDGVGTVLADLYGDIAAAHSGHWYDLIEVYAADSLGVSTGFGSPDAFQVTYLKDMLIEVKYEEDAAGYGTYFDGTNANGNTGTVGWFGTVNASGSHLTGTDVVTGSLTYNGDSLSGGTLYVDTLTESQVNLGHGGVRATEAITVNPSAPAAPVVTLTVDSTNGVMNLSVNANDGAATYKTVSFDIFRGATRVATGLTPDQSTRLATYLDIPASGELATYTVRAFDAVGGWADTTTGTVQ